MGRIGDVKKAGETLEGLMMELDHARMAEKTRRKVSVVCTIARDALRTLDQGCLPSEKSSLMAECERLRKQVVYLGQLADEKGDRELKWRKAHGILLHEAKQKDVYIRLLEENLEDLRRQTRDPVQVGEEIFERYPWWKRILGIGRTR